MASCTRMTVTAMGLDRDNNVFSAQNGNDEYLVDCTGEEGKCGCMHAEDRLLQIVPNPWYVIVSHSPCLACAKLLVEAGVETVGYLKEYRLSEGLEYLMSNHVRVLNVTEETILHMPKQPMNYIKIEGSFEL